MPELEEAHLTDDVAVRDGQPAALPLPSEADPLLPAGQSAQAVGGEADQTATPQCERDTVTSLRHVIFSSFIFVLGLTISAPIRPKIVLDATGGDASLAAYYTGFVDSLQSVIGIVLIPLLGTVADITGRRPILLMCHFGEVLALLILAQFQSSLLIQFPAYMLIPINGAYFVVSSTMIADLVTGDTLQATAYFGYSGAVAGVAFMIGPTVGGIMENNFYSGASLHLAAGIVGISFVYTYLFLPETLASTTALANADPTTTGDGASPTTTMASFRQTADRISHAVSVTNLNPLPRVYSFFGNTPAMRWLAFALAAESLARSGLMSFIFLYLQKKLGWLPQDIGFYLSMFGVCLIVSMGVFAPLIMKQLGERWTIIFSLAMHVIHYTMFGLARDTTQVYITMAVGSFAFVYEPAVKAVLSKQVSSERQGALQGSLAALRDVVKPFGPIVSSALFGFGNTIGILALPFFFEAVLSLVAAVLATIALSKPGIKL